LVERRKCYLENQLLPVCTIQKVSFTSTTSISSRLTVNAVTSISDDPAESDNDTEGSPDKRNNKKFWIVIVDDEDPIRTSVARLLQLSYPSARVTACSNAKAVLDLLRRSANEAPPTRSPGTVAVDNGPDKSNDGGPNGPLDLSVVLPDLIVADVRMPEMSGLELVEAMRPPSSLSSSLLWASVPVILLTAKSALKDRLAGYQAGADAYLTKPFDPDELLALVDSILERRNALAGLQTARDESNSPRPTVQDLQRDLKDIKSLLQDQGGAGPGVNGYVERTGIFLAPDERQVLELLCQGRTNPEIAASLYLSRRRVEQLLTALYRKVSVKNRTELVRWAIATGQVTV
jgi:DNA-binding NarL/FixJ family response regulator